MPNFVRVVSLFLVTISLLGNTPTPSPYDVIPTPIPTVIPEREATAHRRAVMFAGPGETHRQVDFLNAGVPITIVGRNQLGNWLHIIRRTEIGSIAQDGWVMSGMLNLDENLFYSELPIEEGLVDAEPDNVVGESIAQLYELPILPEIHPDMIEVYERGLELGNQPNVITKVGDSLSADVNYLTYMSQDDYELGPYNYLQETIEFYGDSTAGNSVAARIGMSSLVVFDPFWANAELCEPNETPLVCEYRLKMPSVAFIMFGPNDVRSMDTETYTTQMRRILEETLDKGIIPVLSTFSASPNHFLWWQSVNFNLALMEIAGEYNVPIVNLWAAARPLPDYGLDNDRVHLLQSGFRYLKFTDGRETFYGATLQNLLSIRVLYSIQEAVGLLESQ